MPTPTADIPGFRGQGVPVDSSAGTTAILTETSDTSRWDGAAVDAAT